MAISPVASTNVESNSTKRERQATLVQSIAERVRGRAKLLDLSYTDILNSLEISPSSMANYWSGKRPWPVEFLSPLADLLNTNVDSLLGRSTNVHIARDAGTADWVEVPEYDLRGVNRNGLGSPLSSTTFRRDWLYRTLGESTGLWITRTLAPIRQVDIAAGAPIFCKDHPEGELPIEGQYYVFRLHEGGIIIAPFTFRGLGIRNTGAIYPEISVTPPDLAEGDNQHFIIARVVGALARPL